MLQEALALLQKIEEGIKHKSFVRLLTTESGLAIQSDFRCKKDNQVYAFERVFSRQEMMKCNEDWLVDQKKSAASPVVQGGVKRPVF